MAVSETKRFNPFPGLRPFSTEEDFLFFGREEQTAELLTLLREHRFISVVGTSGSGKSSLVRAGLLPALQGGAMTGAGSTWEIVLMRPGGDPITNLAQAILDVDLYDAEDPESLPRLKATLSRSRNGLVQAMRQSDIAERTNLLVVVDQFEELFRFRQSGINGQEGAAAFVKLLLTASDEQDPIYIAITMRSDYLGECSQIPGLAEAVNSGEYLIPRLTRQQRRAAIEKPVSVGGAAIAPRLVQKLLNDVGDDADQLPVLQHALMRIWDGWFQEHAQEEPLDLRHYEQVGGLQHALSIHADEVYHELATDRLRSVAERVFRALTERGADNRGIRRPTRMGHLCEIANASEDEVNTVVNAFRGSGRTFLMPMQHVALSPETVIDISHESLMRVWQRLSAWVEDESQSARIYRRLAETALLHQEGKAGVYHDPDLQIALTWRDANQPTAAWANRYHDGFQQAMDFLDASSQARAAAENAREAARQKELQQARRLAEAEHQRAEIQQKAARRLRGMLGGLALLTLLAMVACGAALMARRAANQSAEEARRARKEALEKEQLATEAKIEAQANAVEASRQERLAEDRAKAIRENLYVSQISVAANLWQEPFGGGKLRSVLDELRPQDGEKDLRGWEFYHLLSLVNQQQRSLTPGGGPLNLRWSPDGRYVAAGRFGRLIQIMDVLTGQVVITLSGHAGWVPSVSWSPDGKRLASASNDKTVKIWNLLLGEEDLTLTGHAAGVRGVAWSPDGTQLASASLDNTVKIWDVSTGKTVRTLSGHRDGLWDVQWSPDGDRLASASRDFDVRVWSREGELLQTLSGHSDTVHAVNWSPDGQMLATTSGDRTARVWDLASGQPIFEISGQTYYSRAVFDPRGKYLATSVMGRVDIYDLASKQRVQNMLGHGGQIFGLDFSPDGQRLISCSFDGDTRIWSVDTEQRRSGQERISLPGHGKIRGEKLPVAWSPSGHRLATSGDDGALRIWDSSSGADLARLEGDRARITSIAWASNGKFIATGSQDSSVKVWQWDGLAGTGQEAMFFRESRDWVQSVAWSPDASQLAWGGSDNGVFLWQSEGIEGPRLLTDFGFKVDCVAWSRDGMLLAISGQEEEGRIGIWDIRTMKKVKDLQGGHARRRISALAWSPCDARLASGDNGGQIVVWDTTSGAVMLSFAADQDRVNDLQWHPDASRLASVAMNDNKVRIWDAENGQELIALRGHDGTVKSVAWSPDGFRLATGGDDGTVKIWDAAEGYRRAGSPTIVRKLLNSSENRNGQDWLQLGLTCAQEGDWEQAEAHIKKAYQAETPPRQPFVQTSWWVAGPFPISELEDGPPPAVHPEHVPPRSKKPTATAGETSLAWRLAGASSFVNFRDLGVSGENIESYATMRVYAPEQVRVALMTGDDDGIRVWLNGQNIFNSGADGGGAAADEDRLVVTLAEGWNLVVAVVDNGVQGHAMHFRLSAAPMDLMRAYASAGKTKEAIAMMEAEGSENLSLLAAAAWMYEQHADQLLREGDAAESERLLEKASSSLEQLLMRQPDSSAVARHLAQLAERLAWRSLRPLEATSENGATLEVLPDDSLLASGSSPAQDTYTVVTETEMAGITGLRLEALPDPSLPSNGAGRSAGSFLLTGIKAFATSEALPDSPIEISFAGVTATLSNASEEVAEVLDPTSESGWGNWPHVGKRASALFSIADPVGDGGKVRLTIKLHFGSQDWPRQCLGRFRLAITSMPQPASLQQAIEGENSVAALLAMAHLSRGDVAAAARALEASIEKQGDNAMCQLLLSRAYWRLNRPEDARAALLRAMNRMARDGAQESLLNLAVHDLTTVLQENSEDVPLLEMRAAALAQTGHRQAALADYQKALQLDPEDQRSKQLIADLQEEAIADWHFAFGGGQWLSVGGGRVTSVDHGIRLEGSAESRGLATDLRADDNWKELQLRVRSDAKISGRVLWAHAGADQEEDTDVWIYRPHQSCAFFADATNMQWRDVKVYFKPASNLRHLRIDFDGDQPVELDYVLIRNIDFQTRADDLVAQADRNVEAYPQDAHALVQRAMILEELGRYEEVSADLQRALELAPDDLTVSQAAFQFDIKFNSEIIVPVGVEWKYLHPVNGDPATADEDFHGTFAKPEFDDSAWQTGTDSAGPEGGFGYGDEAAVPLDQPDDGKRFSAYFRHEFTIDQPMSKLHLLLQRDDGVIVYLDGIEVGRDNMPTAKREAYQLFAENTIGGRRETKLNIMSLRGSLAPGKHLLAISLHNRAATSSDLRIAEISLRGIPQQESPPATE